MVIKGPTLEQEYIQKSPRVIVALKKPRVARNQVDEPEVINKPKTPVEKQEPKQEERGTVVGEKKLLMISRENIALPPEKFVQKKSSSTIFDPRLREKIRSEEEKSFIETPSRHPYSMTAPDGSGERIIVLREGKCFRVKRDLNGSGESWSLPYNCNGAPDSSRRMADNIRRALQE